MEACSIIATMIPRRLVSALTSALAEAPAVALLGPRQVGKTTLALDLARKLDGRRPAVYLDLESEADRAKLSEPELYLAQHADKLVILDEIQRTPQLFASLRGLIDAGRRRGQGKGRFLVLGSASIDLLKQSSETLAGRIRYLELAPLDAGEVGGKRLDALWLRGGFPGSLLADSDAASLRYSRDAIENHVVDGNEQFGFRLRNRAIEIQLGNGNWQALTDATLLAVTQFEIAPQQGVIDLGAACPTPCPPDSEACPRQQVRSLALQISAHALADAPVTRSVHALVRVRNDAAAGACPA